MFKLEVYPERALTFVFLGLRQILNLIDLVLEQKGFTDQSPNHPSYLKEPVYQQ